MGTDESQGGTTRNVSQGGLSMALFMVECGLLQDWKWLNVSEWEVMALKLFQCLLLQQGLEQPFLAPWC